MLNILREPDKKFVLRNCLLLSTVCAMFFYINNVQASTTTSKTMNKNGVIVRYSETKTDGGSTFYRLLGVKLSEDYSYDQTLNKLVFDFGQIFSGHNVFLGSAGESWGNNFNDFKNGVDGIHSYYTNIEFDEDSKVLTLSNKLINQSTLDQALQDAGIGDMSIYAKTADVYGKSEVYTKAESDAKYLTTHQDISGKANVGDSYTKEESDAKYLTTHQDISGKANVGDSYTKAESDGKYATKSALNEYIKSSEIYDYIDYVAPKAITPTRDAMKAYQNDAGHGRYFGGTQTYADNEKSIKLSGRTYYYIPDEKSYSMNKTLEQLTASNVNLNFAYHGDYVFTTNRGGSWTFDTSALSASNIITTEATLDDYTYTKADENGFLTAYKVSGLRNTDERNTDLTTNIIGGYYEGQKSTKEKEGGALTITNNTINKIEADFIGNQHTNGHSGGAIYNGEGGIVKMLIGDFAGNSATYGGAIKNTNTITTILGDFNGNTASSSGGAISNSGTITTLIGDYNGNTATVMGGAVSNSSGATITTLSGNFNNNTATNSFGGAILNGGVISSITGDFNYNQSGNYGGAIYNTSANSEIGTIIGNFNNNKTVKFGGAIYNEQGTIKKIAGNFNNNKSEWDGGAIYNASNGTIENIVGDFIGNESPRGAGIYNAGTIKNYTGNFKNNKGTAIINAGTMGISANNQDVLFYNNGNSDVGYFDLSGGTFNLNAQTGKKMSFGGKVIGTLNINNDENSANRGGDYIFNNEMNVDMNLYNGANVKLGKIIQEDGTTTYGYITPYGSISLQVNGDGNNIDMRNDHIDTNTVSNLSLGGNLGLSIDTSLRRHSTSTSDKLISTSAATGDGKMIINAINLTNSSYGEGDSMKVSIADDKTKGKIAIADDILDNVTGATNYYTKVEYDEDTGDLVFTDKLVNKSTLDQALQDAGIGDMSIYAKKDDVYTQTQADNKFATKESLGSYVTSESLGTTLGGYVTTGGLNTALTPYAKSSDVAETYATKDSITDMLTKTEAGSTYATKTSVYTKDEANETFAVKGSSYTKSEIDETLGGYVTTGGLNTALTPYAKSSDVADTYATKEALTTGLGNKVDTSAFNEYKIEVGNTYAKSDAVYSKNDIDTKLGGYVKSDDLSTTLSDYAKSTDLNDYAKSSDLGAYAKTSDIAETYATKNELGNYVTSNSLDNKLGDYAKTSDLSDYAKTSDLGSYVKSSELDSTLSGYAKASDISDMLTKTEAGNTYATKNELGSYAKSSDVADTYATKDALTTGLGNKVDTSAFNEYKTTVSDTYATKESLGSYVTSESLGTTLGGYASKDSVYTKEEINSTLGSYVKMSEVGDYVDLTDYAKTADVYTQTQANDKFATKEALTTGLGNKVDTSAFNEYKTEVGNTYATKESLNDYAKTSDLSDYAKSSDISDMLTKTEAGNTYATKDSLNGYAKSDDVYSKNDMDTKLSGYVTSDNLDAKLGSYVKSDDLTTTLGSYAKTSDLDAYAKTADIESTYATKASLNEYVKSNDLDSKLSDYAKSDDVYSKNDIDTKLGGYVTSDNLDTKLGSYVKSDDLTTTLGSYAKTEDIANTYATKDELDGKVDTSAFNTYKTEVGNTYATKDELGNKADASTVTALQTTVSDLSDTVAGKANQSDLEALQTTVAGKANASDVYTKDEADNKYATQNAISDMLTKTEAGNTYATQSALNDYKTSNDNAVSALTGKMTQAETDISDIKGSAVMSSGITAEKVAAYEGYAALIDAKQDALSTEQMAVLNSGITAADIATVQTANTRLDAMDTTVADLSADFGDVADFSNSKTGNLKNDVPSSSKPNASTVTKAIANMDATIGQIHGLAAKVGVENGGANLGQNTTVEEHLTSLAGSIGNRTHYTQQNYIKNNQTVAQSLDNLDIAVGSMRRDFASAQIANEARFNDIEHNINHLENKMEKGLAANNALAALKPLSSTYQTQLSAAMGGYENNQAFAIGGFHYVTEKVLLNTGVAYGGNNSMSYNVGVTFGF